MGRTVAAPLKDPEAIVLAKGRSYVVRRRYMQIQVFSTWWTEIELLTHHFGGHYYRHLSGYTWMLTDRDEIYALVGRLLPKLPSATHFEDQVLRVWEEEKKRTSARS